MVTGSNIPEALQITAAHLSDALGGLPLDKQRYADAAEEVLKTAITDFLSKTEG
jgi:NifU-like protein involved in Fe-S cluster formation